MGLSTWLFNWHCAPKLHPITVICKSFNTNKGKKDDPWSPKPWNLWVSANLKTPQFIKKKKKHLLLKHKLWRDLPYRSYLSNSLPFTELPKLSLKYELAVDNSQRRQWHPTPVLLPGKSQGWRSLVGCSPWGRSESDSTEQLHFYFSLSCIREGNGNPLQCSCLENPRNGGD